MNDIDILNYVMNFRQNLIRAVLPYTNTAVLLCHYIVSQIQMFGQRCTISHATTLCNKSTEDAILEVSYRIGDRKYIVIIDKPLVVPAKEIKYAAIESPHKVIVITDLLVSLYGPNGDFHNRSIRPKDILDWYFSDDVLDHEESVLVIITAQSLDFTELRVPLNGVILANSV
jgi:hypothetical protein